MTVLKRKLLKWDSTLESGVTFLHELAHWLVARALGFDARIDGDKCIISWLQLRHETETLFDLPSNAMRCKMILIQLAPMFLGALPTVAFSLVCKNAFWSIRAYVVLLYLYWLLMCEGDFRNAYRVIRNRIKVVSKTQK